MGGKFGGAEKGSRDGSLPLCLFTGTDVAGTGTLAAMRLGFLRQGHLSSDRVKPNTVELTVKQWQAVGYFALSPCGRG